MIDRLVEFALKQRFLVLGLTLVLIIAGVVSYRKLPVDAFPDVTNVQVQVITETPGYSPLESEKFVTFPIEVQLSGLPDLEELRSLSKFGLSMVTITFKDNVDIYFARQLVLERLIQAKQSLPAEIEPQMGPISTGLGEIYQYTVERKEDNSGKGQTKHDETQELIDLRTVQDWIVRPLLKTVPGVADVNSFGGYVKQYQVNIDPEKLRLYELTLRDVFEAVARNNSSKGGNFIEHNSEQYLVRGIGLVTSVDDIRRIVIKTNKTVPVLIRDVATVEIGPEVRQGAIVKDGKGEAVAGIVLMLRGASGKEVAESVKEKVKTIQKALPEGVTIKPFYDRTELVEKCIETVVSALREGAVLVVIVLIIFLGNWRSALIVAATLPLSVLFTFILMKQTGLSANLMSLGGLAIAIGMMVDASVVVVENIFRLLVHHQKDKMSRVEIVSQAVKEVGRPVFFGILIIIVVFMPLFSLQGVEGKMFKPLAIAISYALVGSLLLSFTLAPVLCSFFLKAPEKEEDPWVIRKSKRYYVPSLNWCMKRRRTVVVLAVAALLLSFALVPFIGTEFVPILDEGSLTPQMIRLPSIALPDSIELEKEMQRRLMKFPEVITVVSKIGRAEIASDPMGVNVSDPIVILKPRSEWKTAKTKDELIEKMSDELKEIPGAGFNISQPIALRVDELISGVKSQLAIKLFGDDLDTLLAKANEIAKVMSSVRGVSDLRVEQVSGQTYLNIEVDRSAISRYGISVDDVQDIIETAIGGKDATDVFEGEKRFALVVRLAEGKRNSPEAIGGILVSTPTGLRVPLAQLAKISEVEGPAQISRDDSKRRIVIECNVRDRDIGSFVAEAQENIDQKVKLPAGYYVTWGGQFENQQRAMATLAIVVPIVLALIFILLFANFNSAKSALLIILNVPFAMIGGIVALFVSRLYLSVPASVGFIALFGVAVLNGIVLVSYIRQLRREGLKVNEAVTKACELRLRPVLMTALVAALGLIPLLFASGTGSEIQKPLAVVVIGGLISSTALTLLVLPTIYGWFEREEIEF